MDQKTKKNNKLRILCGIVLLIGAACRAASLFGFSIPYIGYGIGSGWVFIIRDILSTAGCAAAGIAVLAGKRRLVGAGMFACSAAFAIDMVYIFTVTISNAIYYFGGFISYLFSLDIMSYIISCICGTAGSFLLALMFSRKAERENPDLGEAGSIMLTACSVILLVLTMYFVHYYVYSLYDLWFLFTGTAIDTLAFAIVGAAGAAMLPRAAAVSDDTVAFLKKYKELMDMGVITQEEFDAKKAELLK